MYVHEILHDHYVTNHDGYDYVSDDYDYDVSYLFNIHNIILLK